MKSVNFSKYRYIGDPINAVRIFNDLKADELVFLDITASKSKSTISLDFVKRVGDEANMPFAVGGGIKNISQIREILKLGAEKVVINTAAYENPGFIVEASKEFGSSTIVVSIDAYKKKFGKLQSYVLSGSKSTSLTPKEFAMILEANGAGEIILNSINQDGLMKGYDIPMIKSVSESVSIPVVALGGAGSLADLKRVIHEGYASAAAAGSMFVYHGTRNAVLINYPSKEELNNMTLLTPSP